MVRHLAIVTLVALCLSVAVLVDAEVANAEFLKKQIAVYDVLWRVDQPDMFPKIYDLGKSYDLEKSLGSYKHEECVTKFLKLYKHGMLPRGEIFSVFYPSHLEQAIALFRVFYQSKDFDTLYKTAAWARIYVNEGLFVYAFSVAVVHHPDTQRIRVPPYHETNPHLYFNNEVIREAYSAKAYTDPAKSSSGDQAITIYANHSSYKGFNNEYKLRYFTEDVALNDIYYYAHLGHPFWMSTEEYGLTARLRGEVFFLSYKLQLTRYYMERLSNDLGEVEDFDWNYPMPYGFYPSLSYYNGLQLPHRDEHATIPSYNYKFLKQLRDYEQRISMAIDMGKVIDKEGKLIPIDSPNGIQILGNLIEGNADSINNGVYGSYYRVAKDVLGFSPAPIGKDNVLPSMLQHYGLDQRDPMFWSLGKKIMGFYEQFMSKLPKYTYQELAFPGLKIHSLEVDRITTFFEDYDYLISGAVKIYRSEDQTLIKARQQRLTHKPYTYTLTIESEKALKGNVRIFLGPKYNVYGDEIDISENYRNFLLLDEWIVDFAVGLNKVERRSTEAFSAVAVEMSGDLFYKKIVRALNGEETYEIPQKIYPERTAMPKGKKEGMPYQFFVFVTPYAGERFFYSKTPVLGERDFLNMPLGFPLERPVAFNFTDLPNACFKEFLIYHKHESAINLTA